MVNTNPFERTIVLDFEFQGRAGDRPALICLAWQDLVSGQAGRIWLDDKVHVDCPFNIGPDTLFVAYYAVAEMQCFLSLGWDLPVNVVDLFAEYRLLSNDDRPRGKRGLLAACEEFGIPSMDSAHKQMMRDVAIAGGLFSSEERAALLDYCAEDVAQTAHLWQRMIHLIDLPRALIRGKYTAALARVETAGIPIDPVIFGLLRSDWPRFLKDLCEHVDVDFGVHEDGRFRSESWLNYCEYVGVEWPLLDDGRPDLKQSTFNAMATRHTFIEPIAKLRWLRSKMQTLDIQVGDDSRNRAMSSPFGTKTSRNTPSSTKYIFGCHPGFRGLIKPEPGTALAYLDYSQQEIMVAAALSGDANLLDAYQSGDPYIAFAKLAKAVPPDATKASHPKERTLYKRCCLATQYGMGLTTLAEQAGIGEPHARELIEHHRRVFPDYWAFTQRIQDHGMLGMPLTTAFGWRFRARHPVKPTTFCNWPIQATGAEILRVALILLVEAGISVVATVHDAVMIEAPINKIDSLASRAKEIMEAASKVVLGDHTVQVDCEIVRYPDRFQDEKGDALWKLIEAYFSDARTLAKLADPGGATE